jgi:hypothetical protein
VNKKNAMLNLMRSFGEKNRADFENQTTMLGVEGGSTYGSHWRI